MKLNDKILKAFKESQEQEQELSSIEKFKKILIDKGFEDIGNNKFRIETIVDSNLFILELEFVGDKFEVSLRWAGDDTNLLANRPLRIEYIDDAIEVFEDLSNNEIKTQLNNLAKSLTFFANLIG